MYSHSIKDDNNVGPAGGFRAAGTWQKTRRASDPFRRRREGKRLTRATERFERVAPTRRLRIRKRTNISMSLLGSK